VRVTLIHNPSAGLDGLDGIALASLMLSAGYHVRQQSRKSKSFPAALSEPADLIAVAGGDGTVITVIDRLPPQAPPIAIIPAGNANNIANSLGIGGRPQEIIAAWEGAERRKLDCWEAHGPWGVRLIVEGVGLGALADIMAKHKRGHRKFSVEEARTHLRERLDKQRARAARLRLDDKRIEGEFVLLEILNFPMVGPRAALAPDADPFDGTLDVVCVRPEDHDLVCAWLDAGGGPPPIAAKRARDVTLTWEDGPVHLGDKIWEASSTPPWTMTMRRARSVDILTPPLRALR